MGGENPPWRLAVAASLHLLCPGACSLLQSWARAQGGSSGCAVSHTGEFVPCVAMEGCVLGAASQGSFCVCR